MDWSDLLSQLFSNGYWIFILGGTAYSMFRLKRGTSALAEALGARVIKSTAVRQVLKGKQSGRRWRLQLQADGNNAAVMATLTSRLEELPQSVKFSRKGGLRIGGRKAVEDLDAEVKIGGAARWQLLFADRETRIVLMRALSKFDVSCKDGRLTIKSRFNSMDAETAQSMIDSLVQLADLLSVPVASLRDRAEEFVRTDAPVQARALALHRLLRRPDEATLRLAAWAMEGEPGGIASARLFELAQQKRWNEWLLRPVWAAEAPEDALPAYVAAVAPIFAPGLEPVLIALLDRTRGGAQARVIELLGMRGGREAVAPLRAVGGTKADVAVNAIQERLGATGGGLAVVPEPAGAGALSLQEREGALALVAGTAR